MMAVIVDHQHGFKNFTRPPRCRLQSYSHLDQTMCEFSHTSNYVARSLKQAFEAANNGLHRSFSTPCLPIATTLEEDQFDINIANPRIEIVGGHDNGDPRTRALVVEVAIAIASGSSPEPVTTGLSGAYFIHGRRNKETIAVVKPVDEEPLAFNNPKGFAATGLMLGQPGLRRSIPLGETGLRELAAYLLDHGGFAGVPPTALVKISHVAFHVNTTTHSEANSAPPPIKIASVQRFINHDSDAGDLGPSGFSVSSIHCIGILDVRILNLDRHAGNMLIVKHEHESSDASGTTKLVPIDHGLCLPESLDDPYFEWLHWPQASVPFSELEVEYVLNLDPFTDAELLRKEIPSIRESAIRVLVLCTFFLKQSVVAGLCLADIGEMMTREFQGGKENLSVLENLCLNAKAMINNSSTGSLSEYDANEGQCEEETEIFQFDYGCEESSTEVMPIILPDQLLHGSDVHVIGKTPRTAKFSSARSMSELVEHPALCQPLHQQEVYQDDHGRINTIRNNYNDNGESGQDQYKVRSLNRSMSCLASNQNHENIGGISFGEISNLEWELLLQNFEKLLPEVFNGRKRMSLMKQRLGTSCEF